MRARAWIAAGWALVLPAAFCGLTTYMFLDTSFPAGNEVMTVGGVQIASGPGYLSAGSYLLSAGLALSGSLACFFRAAHLRTLAAVTEIRAKVTCDQLHGEPPAGRVRE